MAIGPKDCPRDRQHTPCCAIRQMRRYRSFASKWGVDVATIEAQAPALADLIDLCVPDKQVPAGLKLLAALLGTIFSLVLLGAASGLVHAGHDWVMRFVVR